MPELSLTSGIPIVSLLLRVACAFVFGAIMGFDREVRDRPAGIRTYVMVSVAACIFALITIEMMAVFGSDSDRTQLDPIRVVEAITAGVAFLGAGTIIQSGGSVKGLTTGAGMWLAGAVGLACGTGFLLLGFLGAALALIVFIPLRLLETAWFGKSPVEEYKLGSQSEDDDAADAADRSKSSGTGAE